MLDLGNRQVFQFGQSIANGGLGVGFRIDVRDVYLSAGAGFLYALLGEMMTMPGLGSTPALLNIDIDEDGKIQGLS